jgi:hypothetical protein
MALGTSLLAVAGVAGQQGMWAGLVIAGIGLCVAVAVVIGAIVWPTKQVPATCKWFIVHILRNIT